MSMLLWSLATTIFLGGVQSSDAAPSEPPPKDDVTEEVGKRLENPLSGSGAKESEKKLRKPLGLRKAGESNDEADSKMKKESDELEPPVIDSRIPKPEELEPEEMLDDQLQKELGQDLEAPESEDPVTRLADQMRQSEERLARLDDQAETIELQEKIVKELEELLKQSQQNPNNNPLSKQNQQSAKKRKQLEQMMQQQMRRQQQMAQQQNDRASEPTDRIGPPRSARERTSPQADERAVWGHLPEMLRAEMGQYAKENFLDKYREMIERYYTDISRRSGSGLEGGR